ncbi:hypothetical protein RCL1_006117 [Eukaryota sp. TZLM3-RCL]
MAADLFSFGNDSYSFQHPIDSILESFRINKLFCNLTLKYQGDEVQCHKDLLSVYLHFLDDSVLIDLSEISECCFDDITSLVAAFYGDTLLLTKLNCSSFSSLARFFQCNFLHQTCDSISSSTEENPNVELILLDETFLADVRKIPFDFTILYNGAKIKTHKFLLVAFLKYFDTMWSLDPSTVDFSLDFSDKFFFSPKEFLSFWKCFYTLKPVIPDSEFYVFYHLSAYFQYNQLHMELRDHLNSLKPYSHWVERTITLANDHEDIEFIEMFAKYLNRENEFSLSDPLLLKSTACKVFARSLTSGKMIAWLTKSLVLSYSAGLVAPNEVVNVLSMLQLGGTDPVLLYCELKSLLDSKELTQEVAIFFGNVLLPLIVKHFSSSLSNSQSRCSELSKALKTSQNYLERYKISSVFETYRKEVVFYTPGVNVPTSSYNYSPLKTLTVESSKSSASAHVSHPLDGRVTFNLKQVSDGSCIGFFNASTRDLIGFHFFSKDDDLLADMVSIGSFSTAIDSVCTISIVFNFSSNRIVCFQIPLCGVYCSEEIPLDYVLSVFLKNPGSSCTVSIK